ncbi:acyl-CoA dehydrogenase family protein [Streptomyces sp. NPDC051940]|uniref:acyl-CoA dehydrogenase family protein n=1 Tax=Streptomyces sp. NPDC051940 TaxID=3155675 RepID=UPI003437CA90
MDFAFTAEDDAFRAEARQWLAARVPGASDRRAWEKELGAAGWIGIGWQTGGYGNRTASLTQQVVWAEEYVRSGAPHRMGHIGERLLAPTLIAHGSPEQRDRFLPPVARGEELWCQGYSEPGAGSDLAGLRTAAVRSGSGGEYRITGQKIWTSLAHEAQWCFVLCRTEPDSARHRGLSFLLVEMDQPGRIEVRPIRQMTGESDFNEVYFDGAVARAEHVVGGEGNGWSVAMSLLAVERGVSTLAQQVGFAAELRAVADCAVATGAVADPVLREGIERAWAELKVMRWNAMRTLGSAGAVRPGAVAPGGVSVPGAASVAKLLWAGWHQRLGELSVAVRGAAGAAGPGVWSASDPYAVDEAQHRLLFSRADTIYGGSNEVQRGILARRVLGLS